MLQQCNHGDAYYHRAMMMTACDLAAITKPWEIQLKVHDIIIELHYQYDIIIVDTLRQEFSIL